MVKEWSVQLDLAKDVLRMLLKDGLDSALDSFTGKWANIDGVHYQRTNGSPYAPCCQRFDYRTARTWTR